MSSLKQSIIYPFFYQKISFLLKHIYQYKILIE